MTQAVLGQQPMAQEWGYIVINDFDRNGWPDILLGHHGDSTRPGYDNPSSYPYGLQLFKNNRNGTFTEVTGTYFPLIQTNVYEHYHCCVCADVDGDGYEEFVIITGYRDSPTDTAGYPDRWFKTTTTPFTDVAPLWGTQDYPSKGISVTALPYIAGADPGTLSVLLANGEPNPAVGRLPRWNLWVRQRGVWTLRLPGNDSPDWTYISNGSGALAHALQGVPYAGGGLVLRDSAVNENVWMIQAVNGQWYFGQGADFVSLGLAALSPYHYDSEFVDVNLDGKSDLVAHDLGSGNVGAGIRVYLSDGGGWPTPGGNPNNSSFYAPSPGDSTSEGRSLAIGDFNNDGFPDIFALFSRGAVVNGQAAKGPDLLLQGNGTGNFTNVFAGSGLDGLVGLTTAAGGGTCAVVDIDMDGRLDLVVGYNELNNPGPFRVYKNASPAGNFVGFILPAAATIGTTVTISAPSGGMRAQQLTARTGWMRQSSRHVHFGVGAYAGPLSVMVQWANGAPPTVGSVYPGAYYWVTSGGFARFK